MADFSMSIESLKKPKAQLQFLQIIPRIFLVLWSWSTASCLRFFGSSYIDGIASEQIAHFPSWTINNAWKFSSVMPYLRLKSLSSDRSLLFLRHFCLYSFSYGLRLIRLCSLRCQSLIILSRFLYAQSLQYLGIRPMGFTSTGVWHTSHKISFGLGFFLAHLIRFFSRQFGQYVEFEKVDPPHVGHIPLDLSNSYLSF